MSTNPFRRSSLKASGSSSIDHPTSNPIAIPNDSGANTPSLSLNTKAPGSSQKHVNFASPPGIPISPVSYPSSSPESTRISPAFSASQPASIASTRYNNAFQPPPEIDIGDTIVAQTPKNVRADRSTFSTNSADDEADAVRKTLSKFASAPKRASTAGAVDQPPQQSAASTRQTLDVDAFARLLLTGESDNGRQLQHESKFKLTDGSAAVNASESSSSADTVSTSHRSIFDRRVGAVETSPSSTDSSEDTDIERSSPTTITTADDPKPKNPPPPPQSRHGKSLKDKQPLSIQSNQAEAAINASASTPQYIGHDVLNQSGHSPLQPPPPPPPLHRRRSHNSDTSITSSNQKMPKTSLDSASVAPGLSQRGPPPPPARRPGTFMERRTSTDLPSTVEESDSHDGSSLLSRKVSETPRPPLPPARHSSGSKRLSLGTMAPPLPPPRRGRGSSRSSIDSQRPSFSALSGLGAVDSTRSSVDFDKSNIESDRKISQGTGTTEIMAELAALQREVDEARRLAGT